MTLPREIVDREYQKFTESTLGDVTTRTCNPELNITNEELIARGLVVGHEIVNKFGRNTDVDTATVPEDIWHGSAVYSGFPISDVETLDVFSSSGNDTSAGSGARTIQLQGLDNNGDRITEIVTLNGTNAVTTTQEFYRMSRAKVLSSGSSNQAFNAGDITVRHTTTTANVMAVMPAGTNQTQIACATIPNGMTGLLRDLFVSVERSNSANITGAIWVREFGSVPRLLRPFSASQTSNIVDEIYGGLVLPALSDIAIRVLSTSANNVGVYAHFDYKLYSNN